MAQRSRLGETEPRVNVYHVLWGLAFAVIGLAVAAATGSLWAGLAVIVAIWAIVAGGYR